ncbi:biotin carboxyl carrier protein of acetyl-CoA carboxylase isoform X2 [Manihot esculenta]|uniref:Uncharacterized protein n=1 Tax=Manihot esculenta TaxID=3983 RepID=A0ACB7HGC9_MANES|nr:biotin carboxyl carrier protein of acetyl-CoA carboxylase isoform X2 [Manihot esculenta]KAG8651507.1 hypothetical protein MANES_07G135900v8 [Manihot esculenta]
MESSVALQSFPCRLYGQRLTVDRKLVSHPVKRNVSLVSCVKVPEDAAAATASKAKSDAKGSLERSSRSATFPNGFEVGDFEMHLRRNVGAIKAPLSNISPTEPPPIPTKPMDVSAPVATTPSPPKTSSEKTTPFTNVSFGKSSKLAVLEASGATGYVLVASPTVGTFRRNRTVKGQRQPAILKEGDIIKEGQVIGYLDQFGTELPVKSDVAGEVIKLLFDDGDAVGYGDPLIAVLPSFPGINQ